MPAYHTLALLDQASRHRKLEAPSSARVSLNKNISWAIFRKGLEASRLVFDFRNCGRSLFVAVAMFKVETQVRFQVGDRLTVPHLLAISIGHAVLNSMLYLGLPGESEGRDGPVVGRMAEYPDDCRWCSELQGPRDGCYPVRDAQDSKGGQVHGKDDEVISAAGWPLGCRGGPGQDVRFRLRQLQDSYRCIRDDRLQPILCRDTGVGTRLLADQGLDLSGSELGAVCLQSVSDCKVEAPAPSQGFEEADDVQGPAQSSANRSATRVELSPGESLCWDRGRARALLLLPRPAMALLCWDGELTLAGPLDRHQSKRTAAGQSVLPRS